MNTFSKHSGATLVMVLQDFKHYDNAGGQLVLVAVQVLIPFRRGLQHFDQSATG